MKKMQLNLAALAVTSFQTSTVPREDGTVFGEEDPCTCPTACTCPGCPSCQGFNTCGNQNTCAATCPFTCDNLSCGVETCWRQQTCDLSCDTCP